MVEFLFSVLLDLAITWPGAFVLWAIGGFQGKFSDEVLVRPESGKIVFISILFWLRVALAGKFLAS